MVVGLSALRTGCLYPQEILLVLISVRGHSAIGRMSMKNPLTIAGIEPETRTSTLTTVLPRSQRIDRQNTIYCCICRKKLNREKVVNEEIEMYVHSK